MGDIPCYRWGKRATGGEKRSERLAVGSGEWALLIVETLVTPHCPPPTAHRLGFRVRAKLGIDFFIRARNFDFDSVLVSIWPTTKLGQNCYISCRDFRFSAL